MNSIDRLFGDFASEAEVRITRMFNAGLTAYTVSEIMPVLAEVDAINSEIENLNQVIEERKDDWVFAVCGMDSNQEKVASYLYGYERSKAPYATIDGICDLSRTSRELYPVKTWQKLIASKKREIEKAKKQLAKSEI